MVIFVIVPLGFVVYYTFTNENGSFTFENFQYVGKYASTYVYSLRLALVATLICLLMAYPFAMILSRSHAKVQTMMMLLIMIPMWINFIIRINAIAFVLEENGIINKAITVLGGKPLKLIHTDFAVVLGMVYNYFPFMLLPIYTVMAKIDKSLYEASADLGGNGWQTLRRVTLPLSIPGVITGITMVFVPAASTNIIAGYLGHTKMIGDIIETTFKTEVNYNVGSTLSLVLMLIILIAMVVMNHFDQDKDGAMLL
jgi:spermidine/putrescine transport system permease protein